METEGKPQPACAETCSVQRAAQDVIAARAEMGKFMASVAKLGMRDLNRNGLFEAMADVSKAGDEAAAAASGMADIAMQTCPLAEGRRIGFKRRLFPTGCGSQVATRQSIKNMGAYRSMVEQSMLNFLDHPELPMDSMDY
jgi:hypothetical protein